MNRHTESEIWLLRWKDHLWYAHQQPHRLEYQHAAADALAQIVMLEALGQ